jgi:hypothetical protein
MTGSNTTDTKVSSEYKHLPAKIYIPHCGKTIILASADNKQLTNLKNSDDPAVQLTDQLVKKIETHNSALTFK